MNKKVEGGKPRVTQPSISLAGLIAKFSDEETCRAYLRDSRWPDGVQCPRCGNKKVYTLKQPFKWQCQSAKCGKRGYRFSVTSGTIFENTKYPLATWFQVAYLMTQSKKGMSALQIHRQIRSGDYRTAWYMCHRLRAAMNNATFEQLIGEVEIDETFIGGKAQNMHAGKRKALSLTGTKGKVAVIGAISRKGNVVAQMIENTDTPTLDSFVRRTVSKDVELVSTDEHSGYRLLSTGFDRFPHEIITHSAGEYVRGKVHTNSIKSFWALLKRGVIGTYHQVSKDYLPLYLNEFTFRHNERRNPEIFQRLISSC